MDWSGSVSAVVLNYETLKPGGAGGSMPCWKAILPLEQRCCSRAEPVAHSGVCTSAASSLLWRPPSWRSCLGRASLPAGPACRRWQRCRQRRWCPRHDPPEKQVLLGYSAHPTTGDDVMGMGDTCRGCHGSTGRVADDAKQLSRGVMKALMRR